MDFSGNGFVFVCIERLGGVVTDKRVCVGKERCMLQIQECVKEGEMGILYGETGSGCLLEGLMLKLKLQYFGHLMPRVDSLEKD